MRVDAYCRSWQVTSSESLEEALDWRDDRGGGIFWVAPDDERYPQLAIRAGSQVADVHYFPSDGHPGFRCLGGVGLLEGGSTLLVYHGCEPATGEETPNEFVVSFDTVRTVAKDFFCSRKMSEAVSWFEL